MVKNVSGLIATKGKTGRIKTRFAGVYSRNIINKRTQKQDVAFDICYRDQEKLKWELIGYQSDGVSAAYANQRRGAILDGISKGDKPKRKNSYITYDEAFNIFTEKWLPNLAKPKDELARYRLYLQVHIGHKKLDAISLLDLEQIKTIMLTKAYSASTVRLALGDVRRVYRKLHEWNIYNGPIPTEHLKLPRMDNARTRYLTLQEAIKLLEAIKIRSKTWHDIAFISLYTGMRKGEVLALKGEHLDFNANKILIKDAKTGSRIVHMTDELKNLFESIRPPSPSHYVFSVRGSSGTKIIKTDSDESFVRAVKDCRLNEGISDTRHRVVFHTLRHTFCS